MKKPKQAETKALAGPPENKAAAPSVSPTVSPSVTPSLAAIPTIDPATGAQIPRTEDASPTPTQGDPAPRVAFGFTPKPAEG